MSTPTSMGFAGALRTTTLIARREVAALFDTPIALVSATVFVLLSNALFMNDFFLEARLSMDAYFAGMPWLLAIFLPAVTMRAWAEEHRQRTVEFLLTLPIQPLQAIIGKYIASLALLAVYLAGSLPIVGMLMVLGDPDLPRIACGYVALIAVGALFVALGMLWSAATSDQIVAFVATAVASLALVLLGQERFVTVLDGLAPSLAPGSFLAQTLSVVPHVQDLRQGIVRTVPLVYFVLAITLLLAGTASVLRGRRG